MPSLEQIIRPFVVDPTTPPVPYVTTSNQPPPDPVTLSIGIGGTSLSDLAQSNPDVAPTFPPTTPPATTDDEDDACSDILQNPVQQPVAVSDVVHDGCGKERRPAPWRVPMIGDSARAGTFF